MRRIIGDLSDRERVLIGLDLLYDELTEDSELEALLDTVEKAGRLEVVEAPPAAESVLPTVPQDLDRPNDGLNPVT